MSKTILPRIALFIIFVLNIVLITNKNITIDTFMIVWVLCLIAKQIINIRANE